MRLLPQPQSLFSRPSIPVPTGPGLQPSAFSLRFGLPVNLNCFPRNPAIPTFFRLSWTLGTTPVLPRHITPALLRYLRGCPPVSFFETKPPSQLSLSSCNHYPVSPYRSPIIDHHFPADPSRQPAFYRSPTNIVVKSTFRSLLQFSTAISSPSAGPGIPSCGTLSGGIRAPPCAPTTFGGGPRQPTNWRPLTLMPMPAEAPTPAVERHFTSSP